MKFCCFACSPWAWWLCLMKNAGSQKLQTSRMWTKSSKSILSIKSSRSRSSVQKLISQLSTTLAGYVALIICWDISMNSNRLSVYQLEYTLGVKGLVALFCESAMIWLLTCLSNFQCWLWWGIPFSISLVQTVKVLVTVFKKYFCQLHRVFTAYTVFHSNFVWGK